MDKIIVLLVILVSLYSCSSGIAPDYFDKICTPHSKFEVDSSRDTYVTEANHDYLSLRSIKIPSDTFFLRIEYYTDTTLKIFEYSFYKLKTAYKIYTFPVDYRSGKILFDKNKDTLRKYTKIIAASNVLDKTFISELENTNILDLYSSSQIPNYPVYGRSYCIQYANKCRYHLAYLDEPFENRKKFKAADDLASFVEYLKNEFNF